jgi:hypothetical protein
MTQRASRKIKTAYALLLSLVFVGCNTTTKDDNSFDAQDLCHPNIVTSGSKTDIFPPTEYLLRKKDYNHAFKAFYQRWFCPNLQGSLDDLDPAERDNGEAVLQEALLSAASKDYLHAEMLLNTHRNRSFAFTTSQLLIGDIYLAENKREDAKNEWQLAECNPGPTQPADDGVSVPNQNIAAREMLDLIHESPRQPINPKVPVELEMLLESFVAPSVATADSHKIGNDFAYLVNSNQYNPDHLKHRCELN